MWVAEVAEFASDSRLSSLPRLELNIGISLTFQLCGATIGIVRSYSPMGAAGIGNAATAFASRAQDLCDLTDMTHPQLYPKSHFKWGDLRLNCVKSPFPSPFRAAQGCVSASSVVEPT